MSRSDLYILAEEIRFWLSYAEAKNATLIAFNAGFLTIITSAEVYKFNNGMIYCISALIFGLFSIFISLITFIPKLNQIKVIDNISETRVLDQNNLNVLYFADISKLTYKIFLKKLKKLFTGNSFKELDEKIARQCYANSKIASFKLVFFKWSLLSFLAAVFSPIILLIFLILLKNGDTEV